jgi:CubicO group peptidase (beta-lactamase class C family)
VELKVDVEAAEAGFDATRLRRIGAHLRRYVDDGLLPGWTLVLARYGQTVLVETYGQRDMEAGAPIELDTIFRAYSMTKPITSVAALMLWEEGAFELKDPVARFILVRRCLRWRTGTFLDGHRPMVEPMQLGTSSPQQRAHLRLRGVHPVDELYRRAGFEWARPRGRPRRRVRPPRRAPAALPARHGVSLQPRHRRPRPGGRVASG